jgi:hypothetical protein
MSCDGASGAATDVSTLKSSLPTVDWLDVKNSVPSATATHPTPEGPSGPGGTCTVPAAVPSLVHTLVVPVPSSPRK